MLRLPEQGKGLDALTLPLGDPAPRIAQAAQAPPGVPQPPPAVMDQAADPEQAAQTHAELFRRGYALATYHYQDAGEDTIRRNEDGSWAFRNDAVLPCVSRLRLGAARRGWAWGISRVADYLETEPFADRAKLLAIGHSRIGKAVLVAGAFDDRIAVVGTGRQRRRGHGRLPVQRRRLRRREGLDDMMRKYPNWFSPHLHQFAGRVLRLPFDQHWFMALAAPRGLISLEGTDDQNCLPRALRAGAATARCRRTRLLRRIANALGVNYAPHRHALTAEDWDALLEFADVTLRGRKPARRFDEFPGR